MTPAATSGNYGLWIHKGALAGGSNLLLDLLHPGTLFRVAMAQQTRDWCLARQGFAPFIPAGYNFRVHSNIAANAVVGLVRIKGVADELRILAGDPKNSFTIQNRGVDGTGHTIFAILRNTTTAIREGVHKLLISARKGVYSRAEYVRVSVMAASGNRPINPVGFNTRMSWLGPRSAVQDASMTQFSFAVRGKFKTLASNRFLFSLLRGVSQDRLFFRVNPAGTITVNFNDAANTLVLNAVSRSVGFGGPIITADTMFTYLFSVDIATAQRNARLNGQNLPYTGTGTTFTSVNSPLNVADCTPLFFGNQPPHGFWPGDGAPEEGEIVFAAFWPGLYIDWATHESSIIDGTGNLITTDPTFTIAGVPSHVCRVVGPVAEMFAGGRDSTISVAPVWRPDNLFDITPA
jgi:hypothetical protein